MKSSYEARACKFAAFLARFFEGCSTCEDFEFAVRWYNARHTRKLQTAHGVSRFVIIRADYVIKFDMTPAEYFEDGRAGNCETEARVYERACEDGYDYLLAKPLVRQFGDFTCSIMPRINGVNDWSRDWSDYCTDDEYEWLTENIHDLHEGNVGYSRRKVVIIDYAWDIDEWEQKNLLLLFGRSPVALASGFANSREVQLFFVCKSGRRSRKQYPITNS